MNIPKIRVGTKIQIISDPHTSCVKIGDVGYIVTDSIFHRGEITDEDGSYWADFKHPRFKAICFGRSYDTSCFKVLKY